MMQRNQVPKKRPKDTLKKQPTASPPADEPKNVFPDRGDDGGKPRNGGGGGAVMAPTSLPNYMKPTSSSGAKAGRARRQEPSSDSLPKRRVTRVARDRALSPKMSCVSGATCSSAMKEIDFPAALDLDLAPGATGAEGPSAARVCPYTYCSLNGHVHAPVVPLRSFLASRRRLIKTQQSMKLKGASPFRRSCRGGGDKNGGGVKIAPLEDAVGDFFVEIYAAPATPRESSDISYSDLSVDEIDATVRRLQYVVFDHRRDGRDGEDKAKDLSSSECSDVVSDGLAELSGMKCQEHESLVSSDDDGCQDEIDEAQDEESISGDASGVRDGENTLGTGCAEETCAGQGDGCKVEEAEQHGEDEENNAACKPEISVEWDTHVPEFVCLDAMGSQDIKIQKQLGNDFQQDDSSADGSDNAYEQESGSDQEPSIDGICSAITGMSLSGDACFDPTDAATCPRNRLIISSRRRTPEEAANLQPFNLRAPNFLPVEPDPEAERVDLRHQMMDERKNAEEWMIDYALRRAVTDLARARKKKVDLLVEAFETVVPPPACEKSMKHDDGKKSFGATRPIHACT